MHIYWCTHSDSHTDSERKYERFHTHFIRITIYKHTYTHNHWRIHLHRCIHAHTYTALETLNMNYEWTAERIYVAMCTLSAFSECNTRTYTYTSGLSILGRLHSHTRTYIGARTKWHSVKSIYSIQFKTCQIQL